MLVWRFTISSGFYANSLQKESWMINWSRKTAPKEISLLTLTPVVAQGTSSQPQWTGRDLSGKVPQFLPMQPSLVDSHPLDSEAASEVFLCLWRKQGLAFLETPCIPTAGAIIGHFRIVHPPRLSPRTEIRIFLIKCIPQAWAYHLDLFCLQSLLQALCTTCFLHFHWFLLFVSLLLCCFKTKFKRWLKACEKVGFAVCFSTFSSSLEKLTETNWLKQIPSKNWS